MEELKRLKIEIIRPSLNQCFAEFKAIDGKIYYGLGAIKNVGLEAISNIIDEREKNGKFKSFINFINRVDAKDVNKLQLEGLQKLVFLMNLTKTEAKSLILSQKLFNK